MGILDAPVTQKTVRRLNNKLQIVSTRGNAMGDGNMLGGGPTANYSRGESRCKFIIGPQPVTGARLVFNNWLSDTVVSEKDGPNDITVSAALEYSGVTYPIYFGGAKSVLLPAGAPFVMSDPMGLELPAGAVTWIRTTVTISAGQFWPKGVYVSVSGEGSVDSNNSATQIYGTGALSPTGGVNSAWAYTALAMLGIPAKATPAVLVIGDSITAGSGESSGTTAEHGFALRGLVNATNPVPWAQVARGGDMASQGTMALTPRRLTVADYATHALCALGTNDLASAGLTAAQTQAALTVLWTRLKAHGLKITASLVMPRIQSTTDSYATPGNMTPYPGFETGGAKRDPLNAWIISQVGQGLIDSVIDPNVYVEDQANKGKWITTGAANYPTTDGVHPSTPLHILAAQPVTAWANQLTL